MIWFNLDKLLFSKNNMTTKELHEKMESHYYNRKRWYPFLSISTRKLNQMYKNEYCTFTILELNSLCRVLNCSIADLISDDGLDPQRQKEHDEAQIIELLAEIEKAHNVNAHTLEE